MRPYRIEYVRLAGWETDKVGLWVAENDEWLLLRHIVVDYLVDGYVLLAKAHIVSRKPGRHREQLEQVLRLKNVKAEAPAGFKFRNPTKMLRWVEQQYGLVEFKDEEESAFLGWVQKADPVHFWLNFLNVDGTVDVSDGEDKPFVLSEIQIISFDSDYFRSMKLLWQHRQQHQLLKPSQN